jgi:PIN domain nuclease of toxin-antitoxin system
MPFPLIANEARQILWTDDIFDRLIVAQASATNSRLITADGVINEHYPLAIW